jgi:protein gp37
MGDRTQISWTDATWNPIRARNASSGKQGWYCEKVTAACDSCYAESQNMRRGDSGGTGLAYKPGHRKDATIYLDRKTLLQPLRWRRGRRIFPLSMTDLFGKWVPDEWIDDIFAVMAMCPQHTFQVLTKRPERMRQYMIERWQGTPAHPEMNIPAGGETGRRSRISAAVQDIAEEAGLADPDKNRFWDEDGSLKALNFGWPLPNVWLGTSICDQPNAEDFVPHLLGTPAALHFVSAAPLLGLIDLSNLKMTPEQAQIMWPGVGHPRQRNICDDRYNALSRPNGIGWVLTEGESGPQARPTDPKWFRIMRDQCAAYNVPFHHKQNGEFAQRDVPKAEWKAPGGDMQIIALNGDVATVLKRVGLRQAGRELDGVTHNAFPVVP